MTKNADTKFGSLSWVELVPDSSDTPSSRSGHSLIYFEGCLYLFGGKDEYSASNELWQYHAEASVWTKLSYSGKTPPRLFNHSAVLYDRKVFIFGGSLGSSFSLWVFDFDVYEWEMYQSKESWPSNRHSQSATLLNNHVYLYGGYTYLGTENDELWTYDLEENEWSKVETTATCDKPPAMFGHTAAFNGPVMWIYGGSHQREIQRSLWSYDTELRQWRQTVKEFAPPPLYYHIAIVTGDVMLIYGGFDENVKNYTGMWRFNFDTEEWRQMVSTELPALAGHAAAVSYVNSTANGDQETKQSNKALYNKQQYTTIDNNILNNSTITVTEFDNTVVTEEALNGDAWSAKEASKEASREGKVVVIDDKKSSETRLSDDGYHSQGLFPVTPGDIELRPITTQSTITVFQHSTDSHVSLPGMVDDEEQCDSPPQHRIYHSVYENRNVSQQLETRPAFCVNNPLYDDTIVFNSESVDEQLSRQTKKPKPSTITFYDTEVIGDCKQDHSDSGSQGSRSSLRKKKQYKRGCNTEFYIVGHGQEALPKSVVLYRCKIV